jgi:hypothetical protein
MSRALGRQWVVLQVLALATAATWAGSMSQDEGDRDGVYRVKHSELIKRLRPVLGFAVVGIAAFVVEGL